MGRSALDQVNQSHAVQGAEMQWGKEPYKNGKTEDNNEDRDRREHADVGPIRSGANVPYVDSIKAHCQWPGVS